MEHETRPDPPVITYATPGPPGTGRRSGDRHAALAVVVLVAFGFSVAAVLAGAFHGVVIALSVNVVVALLVPAVALLTRPGSIHWVAGTLFFLVMILGVTPAAVMTALALVPWVR
jgi:hypothetical protein